MRLSLCWKIISLLLPSSLALAGVRIAGTVYEKGIAKPLANVNVFVLPEALKATTDERGAFVFEDVPIGEREWIVNVTGYQRFKQLFTFTEDSAELEIYLERQSYNQFETTVIGKVEKRDPAKKTLRQAEFLQVPGAGGDPIRALENLPGVGQSFTANVAIQGSPPEDTKYLIEGHEIPFMFHFFGLNTVAVPETVQSVDFLTAGYGVEFGRAASGVINLNLRRPRTERYYGMAFVDFTASGGYFEGKLSGDARRRFFMGGRYSYLGELLKQGAEVARENSEDGNVPPSFSTAPSYFDINLSYHDQLRDNLKFSLITLASRDKVVGLREDAASLVFSGTIFGQFDFFRIIPKLSYQIDKEETLTTSVAAGVDRQRFRPGRQKLNFTNQRLSWRSEYRNKLSPSYRFALGTDHVYERFHNEVRASASFFDEDDIRTPLEASKLLVSEDKGDNLQQGYYLSNRVTVIEDKLILTPNLRYDYFGMHQKGYVQPRGGVVYKINDAAEVYLNSGWYYQPQSSFNLNESTGNPRLKPSKSIHYALRYEHDFRAGRYEGMLLTAGLFYKDLHDLITNSSAEVEGTDGLVPERYSNDGTGTVRGAELLWQYKQRRYYVNLGYTYTKSRRRDGEGKNYPSPQDQTHNLNLTGAYKWGNYTLSVRGRYVTGIPYTPVVGGVYFENADTYVPVPGDKLSQRIKDFWQLDLRLDHRWVYNKWILSLYLDVQNVTMRDNQIGINYSYDYTQSAPTYFIPILPTFGLKGEF